MEPKVRRDDVLAQELGTELLLYDAKQNQAHSLNAVAALIWRHCDGHTSTTDLVKVASEQTALPASEEIVWLALEQLEQAGLLEEPLQRPTSVQAVSRRQLVRKLGLTAALTLLLPLITSMRVSADPLPGGGSPGNPNPEIHCGETITVMGTGRLLLPDCETLNEVHANLAVNRDACERARQDALRQAALLCPSACPATLISQVCHAGECIAVSGLPPQVGRAEFIRTGTFNFKCG